MVHIYCGDGKGKTTASVGLAVRCAGAGGKVLFCQFMKTGDSSEVAVLKSIFGVTVFESYKMTKFSFLMNESEILKTSEMYEKQFSNIIDTVNKNHYDMLILDEVMTCVSLGFLNIDRIIDFLQNHTETEIIMTGRSEYNRIYDYADYISEVKKVKHPYEKGISARKGIEY